jgi:hypothetical protein
MNILTWLADALVVSVSQLRYPYDSDPDIQIYRCFIVWERNYWVIVPSSLILLLSFSA